MPLVYPDGYSALIFAEHFYKHFAVRHRKAAGIYGLLWLLFFLNVSVQQPALSI